MITSCSYDSKSLLFLRSQAILPLHYTSAQALNLWAPSAQQNERGQTQPFPFADYISGIGSVNTIQNINEIFEDMSQDTSAQDSWGATEAQAELSPAADNKTSSVTTDTPVAPTSSVAAASPNAREVRKSSLADLTNGDRGAMNAHLAQRLGPHKFLSRFSQKTDAESVDTVSGRAVQAEVSEPDGAASVVGSLSSAVVIMDETTQTAPDLENSNLLTGTTPTASVTDGNQSATQSSHSSPRAVRRPGPHHRLKVLQAQDIPLPQSPAPVAKSSSDDGPATPVTSALDLEPGIVQGSPPTISTADDDNESDVSSLAYEAFKTELPSSLSDKDKTDPPSLNPKAVDYLPHSRSTSPCTLAQHAISDSEAEYINNCCPVPSDWEVPSCIGSFAHDNLFNDLTIGGIHKPLLIHHSHFFATAFTNDSRVNKEELDRVIKLPSYDVFRKWVYKGKLYVKSDDGVICHDMNLDLKTLVMLWRFAARIQAPLFANTIADAIINKTITAVDLSAAADEIDAVLKVVAINNTFRLLISHSVILSGIQLDQDHYIWPRSLLLSVLGCLKMGRSTYAGIQMSSQTNPCMYHLHPLGTNCKTS